MCLVMLISSWTFFNCSFHIHYIRIAILTIYENETTFRDALLVTIYWMTALRDPSYVAVHAIRSIHDQLLSLYK